MEVDSNRKGVMTLHVTLLSYVSDASPRRKLRVGKWKVIKCFYVRLQNYKSEH